MPDCEVVQNTQRRKVVFTRPTCLLHSLLCSNALVESVLCTIWGVPKASRKWHLMGSVCWRFSPLGGVPMDPGQSPLQ